MLFHPPDSTQPDLACRSHAETLALCQLGTAGSERLSERLADGVRFLLKLKFGITEEAEVLAVSRSLAASLIKIKPTSSSQLEEAVRSSLREQLRRFRMRATSKSSPTKCFATDERVNWLREKIRELCPSERAALLRHLNEAQAVSETATGSMVSENRMREILHSLRVTYKHELACSRKGPRFEKASKGIQPRMLLNAGNA